MSKLEKNLSASDLSEGIAYYPEQLMVRMNQIGFCEMSAETYRQSPFLDHRIVRDGEERFFLPFSEVSDVVGQAVGLRTHFVFHNAFCRSTLLSRYLDALSGPLVLREPNVLYEVATLQRFEGTPMLVALQGVSWDKLYKLIYQLLSRRVFPQLPTIIKPTDACNSIMSPLLSECEGNRGLFIYSTIERFLIAVLRYQPRHEWVKTRVRELLLDDRRATGRLLVQPETLTIPQAAAMVWLLHTNQYLKALSEAGSEAICSVGMDELADDPFEVLGALCVHFSLPFSGDDVARAVDATGAVDSKADKEQFDPVARQREYDNTRNRYSEEIATAIKWVKNYTELRDLEEPLANPLL